MAKSYEGNLHIFEITLPDGNLYEIRDANARERLDSLESITGALMWKGVTSTLIVDGSTAVPSDVYISPDTPAVGDVVLVKRTSAVETGKEFVWDGTKWQELGDLADLTQLLGDLGDMAYVDSVTSGNTTFNGSIETMTLTGETTPFTGIGTTSGVSIADIPYTPEGTISASDDPTDVKTFVNGVTGVPATYSPFATNGSVTNGSAAILTTDVNNGNLTIGWTANTPTTVTLPTANEDLSYVSEVTTTTDTTPIAWNFTGIKDNFSHQVTQGEVTVSGSYTPSVSFPTTPISTSGTVTVTAPAHS